jgi:hypothetical protein
VLCQSGSQGRAIFNHVKIALRKIARTLPSNFKALLTTSPHHIPAEEIFLTEVPVGFGGFSGPWRGKKNFRLRG